MIFDLLSEAKLTNILLSFEFDQCGLISTNRLVGLYFVCIQSDSDHHIEKNHEIHQTTMVVPYGIVVFS
jgi:hypothetical protein